MGYYFLPEDARDSLKTYKYSGADASYLYKYILSPLAAFFVDTVIPITMAPNTITMIGFTFMIVTYALSLWHFPYYNDNAPAWIYAFFGLSILIYQTMDNMDGKQARKTGSSSPLGLLFDHGCDALNVTLGVNVTLCSLNSNPSDPLFHCLVFLVPSLPFFVGTWEHYHTHHLYLPVFNGPSEGLVGLAAICFVSATCGSPFWQETTLYEYLEAMLPTFASIVPKINNCYLIIGATALMAVREVIQKMFHVSKKHGVGSLLNVLPFIKLCCLWLSLAVFCPDIIERNPRMSLNIGGMLFFEMVAQIMFDHITNQQYNPLRIVMLPLIYLWYATCFSGHMKDEDEDDFLLAYFVGLAVYLSMKSFFIIHEVSTCLEIYCFDIVSSYSRGKEKVH